MRTIFSKHLFFLERGEGWGAVSTLISPARKSAPVRTSLSSPAERNLARSVLTGASSLPNPHSIQSCIDIYSHHSFGDASLYLFSS